MRNRLLTALCLLLAVIFTAGCGAAAPAEQGEYVRPNSLYELKFMPPFACEDAYGKAVTNDIFAANKLTFVNVWATWCGPCVYEMPALQALSEEFAARNVGFVGIIDSTTCTPESAQQVLQDIGVTYPNIYPNKQLIIDFFPLVQAFPTSFVVDAQGNIVSDIILGMRTEEDYARLLSDLLAKTE